MTHLERMYCEHKALRPEAGLQASSCGQGCEEGWSPDRSLWNKSSVRVQALGLVCVTVRLWRGPWGQSHYPPGIYCCPNAVHILISRLFL